MTELGADISVNEPVTDAQAGQLRREGAPLVGQGAAAYGKVELAKFVFGGGETRIQDPSEGQLVMAKMLAIRKEDGSLEARPAGFAMVVRGTETFSRERGNREFFDRGAMVLTSGVLVDGKLGFVAADSEGVFVIQAGVVESRDRRRGPEQVVDSELAAE